MARVSPVMSASGVAYGPKVITGKGATAQILMTDDFLRSICTTKYGFKKLYKWKCSSSLRQNNLQVKKPLSVQSHKEPYLTPPTCVS